MTYLDSELIVAATPKRDEFLLIGRDEYDVLNDSSLCPVSPVVKQFPTTHATVHIVHVEQRSGVQASK